MGSDTQRSTRGRKGHGGAFSQGSNVFHDRERSSSRAAFIDVPGGVGTIDKLLESGFAIIFGCTRDGGAISITLLDGDDRHRTYCASQEELNDAFASMAGLVEVERQDGSTFRAEMPKLRKDA